MIWHISYPKQSFGDREKLVYGGWDKVFLVAQKWLDMHYPSKWQYRIVQSGYYQFQLVDNYSGQRVPLRIDELEKSYSLLGQLRESCEVIE